MYFFIRSKLKLFSFLLLLFVVLGTFVVNGILQRQATHAADAISPLTVYVGSGVNVYAFNATNGVKNWSYPTAGDVVTQPAYANGIVYVASNDNYIYALNATTGALVWRYNIGSTQGSPIVSQGIVYIGSDSCYFYALNAKTGKLIWHFSADITPVGCYHSLGTPAVFNGIVYIGGFSSALNALDAKTGKIIWRIQFNNYSSPVIVNGTLYTGPYALNANTGAILWRANINFTIYFDFNLPAISNGMVYLSAVTALGDDLYAIDEKTGAIRWMVPGDFSSRVLMHTRERSILAHMTTLAVFKMLSVLSMPEQVL